LKSSLIWWRLIKESPPDFILSLLRDFGYFVIQRKFTSKAAISYHRGNWRTRHSYRSTAPDTSTPENMPRGGKFLSLHAYFPAYFFKLCYLQYSISSY